jgi:hypothetical protein
MSRPQTPVISSIFQNSLSPQQVFDIKSKQLAQAKHKRKILEETLEGTTAETELLQNKLKSLQIQNEKLDHEIHHKENLAKIFSSSEFQIWWNELLETIKNSSQKIQELSSSSTTNSESNDNFKSLHQMVKRLGHLKQQLKKIQQQNKIPSFSLIPNHTSHSSSNNRSFPSSATSKYCSPLLKETSAMLAEIQRLHFSSSQTQSGPLSQLEERHRQLEIAISAAKRKTRQLNMEADRQERLILIERYTSELPQLRQELATRPKAADVAEFKQRMAVQIQMLSSELNEVLGELQLFEKREELEIEVERKMTESQALRVEVATLQEQLSGLLEFVQEQKENIRQWIETEKPRHEGFVSNLERERIQLLRELKLRNILGNDEDCVDGGHGESRNGNDDEGDDDDDSKVYEVSTVAAAASPKRVVHVVHFDGSNQEVEMKRAPTKRWHRSAKFLSESEAMQHQHMMNSVDSSTSLTNSSGEAASSNSTTTTTFMTQTLKILSDIYIPPLVEFTSTVDEKTGHRKDDRTEASSLTVRVLSQLSSWLWGESSWVERGRKNKKKNSVEVVV